MFELGSPVPNKLHVSIGTALLIIVLKFINDYYAENQNYIYYPTETFIFFPKEILKYTVFLSSNITFFFLKVDSNDP